MGHLALAGSSDGPSFFMASTYDRTKRRKGEDEKENETKAGERDTEEKEAARCFSSSLPTPPPPFSRWAYTASEPTDFHRKNHIRR
jgi:hypothetical protein